MDFKKLTDQTNRRLGAPVLKVNLSEGLIREFWAESGNIYLRLVREVPPNDNPTKAWRTKLNISRIRHTLTSVSGEERPVKMSVIMLYTTYMSSWMQVLSDIKFI